MGPILVTLLLTKQTRNCHMAASAYPRRRDGHTRLCQEEGAELGIVNFVRATIIQHIRIMRSHENNLQDRSSYGQAAIAMVYTDCASSNRNDLDNMACLPRRNNLQFTSTITHIFWTLADSQSYRKSTRVWHLT